MIVRPEIAALRHDDMPQRRIQQRLVAQSADWRSAGPGAAVEAELARLAQGTALRDLPALRALFTPGDRSAVALAEGLTGWLVAELAAEPFGQVPLRHYGDGTVFSLNLARCGTTTLTLQAIDGEGLRRKPAPASVSFAATETWDHVLAGRAAGELVTIAGESGSNVRLLREPIELSDGQVSHRQGQSEAQLILAASGALVTLKLQRRTNADAITREYALADGRLLHQAAGSPRDSRLELAATLLGRMGRSDAAPLLAAMAEETGSPHLRWQALRECLGLDTAQGFATLSELACRTGDPLAPAAGALRAQLIETYPQLAGQPSCPTSST